MVSRLKKIEIESIFSKIKLKKIILRIQLIEIFIIWSLEMLKNILQGIT